uniref:M96 mating-specific protein family n=1 Tax=Globisporangium ultimum (strain ATCC 200006 / CBS 805.95 / DAOM BR144) TaxID=431595 RepID=K3W8W4_GLOUD
MAPPLVTDDDDALQAVLAFVDAFDSPVPSPRGHVDFRSGHALESGVAPTAHDAAREDEPNDQEPRLLLSTTTTTALTSISSTRNSRTITTTTFAQRPTRQKPAKINTNKARDERKAELLYLRRQVLELTSKLRTLQAQDGGRSARRGIVNCGGDLTFQIPIRATQQLLPLPSQPQWNRNAPSAGINSSNVSCDVWQDIAARQNARRIASERENVRLRLVLESQLKVARSLEKFLIKTTSTREIEKCVQIQNQYVPSVESPPPDPTDATVFEELLTGVAQSYAEVDALFAANGLARMETTTSVDAQMRTDRAGYAMCLEVLVNKLLPFDLHVTSATVWNHYVYAKDRIPNRSYSHSTRHKKDGSEDTIVEHFTLRIEVNESSSHNYTKMDDEPLTGVKFLEKGYIVIKRPTRSDESAYALLQTCYIATPVMTVEMAHLDPLKVGTIIDLALAATEANIKSSHQMIEDMLLEQSVANSF